MTVPDQTPQNVHTANGVSTTFAYQFKILDTDHLEVYLDDVLQTSGYSVTGEGVNAGGTVVFTTAPANGTEVILMRSMTIERTAYDYQNAGDFLASTVNEDFDAAIMISQQINNKVDQRALLFPATLDRTSNTNALPEPEEGRVLYWDENGEIQNSLISSLATNPTFASELRTFDTMAQAIADATLEETNVLFVAGRGNSFWNLSASGTANGRDVVALTASGLYATLIKPKILSPETYGLDITGATDITTELDDFMSNAGVIHLVAGTYAVDYLNLYPNTIVVTDGPLTIIQHNAGTGANQRIINTLGSNIHCGTIKIVGRISTDTGEQHHAVYIRASSASYENITFEDIHVQDIRGDAVYIGALSGYELKNVHLGNVVGDNCYRHGVAITGSVSGSCKSIDITRVSIASFEVEPEVSYTDALAFRVGYVRGNSITLVSSDSGNPIDGIYIGYADLKNRGRSDPVYAGGGSRLEYALNLRNCNFIEFGKLIIDDYDKQGIEVTYNGGELGCKHLKIGELIISNCSLSETTYDAFIRSANSELVEIGKITATVPVTAGRAKRLFSGGSNITIFDGDITLGTACIAYHALTGLNANNVVSTGTGRLLSSCAGSLKVSGGSHTGDYLAANTNKIVFENFTATASTALFNSTYDDHVAINSTLNSSYYGMGFTSRSHLLPFRFGDQWLWVDSTGDLRVHTSAPGTDTSGTVVGTQT